MADVVRIFKALGDESRLRVVAALHGQRCCVCRLARTLDIPQPTLSHHLKILRDAGLVVGEKDGPLIHCSLDEAVFAEIGLDIRTVLANFAE